jgi:SCAMP family
MDIIQQQLVKNEVNKVQSSLGLGRDGSSNLSNILGDPEAPKNRDEGTSYVDEAVQHYDSCPRNYPACIPLVFLDRSILAAHAKPAVDAAHVLFLVAVIAASYNVLLHVIIVAILRGLHWVRLVISFFALLFIFAFELIAYITAFRGAYRNSQSLRLSYIIMCCPNMLLFGVYAFVGYAIFHGWMLVVLLGYAGILFSSVIIVFVVVLVEALLWTFLLIFSMFTCFKFCQLQSSYASGLSSVAQAEAKDARPSKLKTRPTGHRLQSAGRARKVSGEGNVNKSRAQSASSDQARVEEIKTRYQQAA